MAIFKRIDRKLLFYFLLITVLLLGIVTFISYDRGVQTIKTQTFSHLRFIAIYLKDHVHTFIIAQKNIARDFGSDRAIVDGLSSLNNPDADIAEITNSINHHLKINKMSLYSPRILNISVLNKDGKVVFSTLNEKIGEDYNEKDPFLKVKNNGYFGDIYYSEVFYEPVMEVSAPIINSGKEGFCGVIVNTISGSTLADVTRSYLLEEYEKMPSDSSVGAYYYGSAGAKKSKKFDAISILKSTEEIYIVNKSKRMVTESKFQKNAVLDQIVDTKPVQMALEGAEEMVGIYKNYKGKQIIGASIFIKELNWVILAEKDISETFAPLFKLKAQLITLAIIALGIVIFVSNVIARKISEPIKRLTKAIIIRSKGDLGYRLEKIEDDELGTLTDSFNKMCEDMENITVSKDYMEKVFCGISESLIITDAHFIIKRLNPATLNILGYTEEDLLGKSVSTIFGGSDQFLDYFGLKELIRHDQILRSQNGIYKAESGENISVSISASVIRVCSHKIHPEDCVNYNARSGCHNCKSINIIIVARDMRAINSLIQKEKERVFELTTIQEISRKLGYTLNYDDLFRLILDPLHTAINFDIAGSVLCNAPDDLIYIRRTRPIKPGFLVQYKESLMKTFIKLSGNTHEVCRKDYIDITSGKDDNNDDFVDNAVDKIKSYFNVPLIVRGKIVGMINISSFKENAFESNHIRMLYTVANQVTISIQHLIALIEHEKGKLSSILRDMVDGVIMVDSKGIIDMVNPAGEKLLKYLSVSRQGELLAHLGDYYLKEPMELILGNKREYISQELTFGQEYDYTTLSMIMSPIRGDTSNIGVVIVLRNITREHNLQQQLVHAEKLSTIGEMVSGIAHEINNPLAGVMGLSQLLQIQPDLSDSVRKSIDKIFTYTDRAKRIIQNLLTFARAHKPEKSAVDLNQLVEQTIEMHEYNMKTNDIVIKRKLDLEAPVIVADMYQMQQVVFNIINNAYQSLTEYDGARIFTVQTRVEGDFLVLSMHNTGHGISNEIIKKMFNPFFTTKEVGKGTGMGLSISYGIVKEHGGDIYAISKKEEGVTFYIRLPIKCDIDENKYHKQKELPEKSVAKVRKMNVIIVDDEITVADSIASLLETEGHDCVVTTKVEEAIEKLVNNRYDLIISDIRMPGLSGKEFYAHLKLNRPNMVSKFVVVTGDVVNPDTKEFVESNNIPCITKPFTFDELKAVVLKISERRRTA